jgi:hypothetical protein
VTGARPTRLVVRRVDGCGCRGGCRAKATRHTALRHGISRGVAAQPMARGTRRAPRNTHTSPSPPPFPEPHAIPRTPSWTPPPSSAARRSPRVATDARASRCRVPFPAARHRRRCTPEPGAFPARTSVMDAWVSRRRAALLARRRGRVRVAVSPAVSAARDRRRCLPVPGASSVRTRHRRLRLPAPRASWTRTSSWTPTPPSAVRRSPDPAIGARVRCAVHRFRHPHLPVERRAPPPSRYRPAGAVRLPGSPGAGR